MPVDPIPTPSPDELPEPVADPVMFNREKLITSFEDQDISEFSGDTADFITSTTFSTDGSYGLEHDTTGYSSITSGSGLNHYPSAENTFKWDSYGDIAGLTNNCQTEFVFGHNGTAGALESCYSVRIEYTDDQFIMFEYDGTGSSTLIDSIGVTITDAGQTTAEIYWPSDPTTTNLEATLYDSTGSTVGSIAGTASTSHTSGGIGHNFYRGDLTQVAAADYGRVQR